MKINIPITWSVLASKYQRTNQTACTGKPNHGRGAKCPLPLPYNVVGLVGEADWYRGVTSPDNEERAKISSSTGRSPSQDCYSSYLNTGIENHKWCTDVVFIGKRWLGITKDNWEDITLYVTSAYTISCLISILLTGAVRHCACTSLNTRPFSRITRSC